MQLINRSANSIFWAVFNAGDLFASTAAGVPRSSGSLASGGTASVDASGGVQIKVYVSLDPTVKMPGFASLPSPTINATRDNTFDDSLSVVFTGSRLVKLDNGYQAMVGLTENVPSETRKTVPVDFTKVVRAVLSLAEALVLSSWPQTPTKFAPAGVFKVALGLVDIFAPTTPASSLDISDIQTSVQNVIDQNEARLLMPHVIDVATWLDKYVRKSNALVVGSPNPTTAELTPYDRSKFLTELSDRVNGRTPFKGTMSTFRDNRAIRKHAIPSYLLGVVLHIHLEILSLIAKQESTRLDIADVNALLAMAETYAKTLPQMEEDYTAFCRDLSNRYPLLSGLDQVGREGVVFAVGWATPSEGVRLGEGAVAKWLQGDRMIIARTGEKLRTFMEAVKKMPVA